MSSVADASAVNPAQDRDEGGASLCPRRSRRRRDQRRPAASPRRGRAGPVAFGAAFDREIERARGEADEFYAGIVPSAATPNKRNVIRQGYAGLLWSKQFYYYVPDHWLFGDRNTPPPPESRKMGRNRDWAHLHSRDILSMPDKWEYPGSPRGTWRSTWFPWPASIPISRSSS